jgi:hypothetical protein
MKADKNYLVDFLQSDLQDIEKILNLYHLTASKEEDRQNFSTLLDTVYYWQRHAKSFKQQEQTQ